MPHAVFNEKVSISSLYLKFYNQYNNLKICEYNMSDAENKLDDYVKNKEFIEQNKHIEKVLLSSAETLLNTFEKDLDNLNKERYTIEEFYNTFKLTIKDKSYSEKFENMCTTLDKILGSDKNKNINIRSYQDYLKERQSLLVLQKNYNDKQADVIKYRTEKKLPPTLSLIKGLYEKEFKNNFDDNFTEIIKIAVSIQYIKNAGENDTEKQKIYEDMVEKNNSEFFNLMQKITEIPNVYNYMEKYIYDANAIEEALAAAKTQVQIKKQVEKREQLKKEALEQIDNLVNTSDEKFCELKEAEKEAKREFDTKKEALKKTENEIDGLLSSHFDFLKESFITLTENQEFTMDSALKEIDKLDNELKETDVSIVKLQKEIHDIDNSIKECKASMIEAETQIKNMMMDNLTSCSVVVPTSMLDNMKNLCSTEDPYNKGLNGLEMISLLSGVDFKKSADESGNQIYTPTSEEVKDALGKIYINGINANDYFQKQLQDDNPSNILKRASDIGIDLLTAYLAKAENNKEYIKNRNTLYNSIILVKRDGVPENQPVILDDTPPKEPKPVKKPTAWEKLTNKNKLQEYDNYQKEYADYRKKLENNHKIKELNNTTVKMCIEQNKVDMIRAYDTENSLLEQIQSQPVMEQPVIKRDLSSFQNTQNNYEKTKSVQQTTAKEHQKSPSKSH